jgi:hypothetical protein
MSAQSHTRYPGAQPFSDDDVSRKLFYGRGQESKALLHQILANRLVVLFARSGLGKTSLLNAGVAKPLRDENYLPLSVRVNDSEQGPLASIYSGIQQVCESQSLEYIPGDKASLWHFFKTAQFWKKDILLTPVLILDQFEELFTLHSEEQRGAFLDQFSNLVRGVRPKLSEQLLAKSGEQDAACSDTAPAIKIIVSLREDFLAQLEEIADRIPGILDQRFRLLPLGRDAATKAMDTPAGIEDPSLETRPFKISTEARNTILDFLERRMTETSIRSRSNIEPFQLQLICQRVEEVAHRAQRDSPEQPIEVGITDIGGESKLRKILTEFYKRQVAAVSSYRQRRGVRKLCSEYLINPLGRRIRMEESEIQRLTRVKPKTLKILVDRRLLRRDQSIDGNYYELSHDSLVIPVVNSVRVWFFMRMVSPLLLTILAWTLSLIYLVVFIESVVEAPQNKRDLFDDLFIVILLAGLLWLFASWGIRNYRRFREMWRRFKI